jgi:carbon monoxide dehydrogenase subunit G
VTLNYEGSFDVSRGAEGVTQVLADPRLVFPALPRYHSMRVRGGDQSKFLVRLKIGPSWLPPVGMTTLALKQSRSSDSVVFDGRGILIGGHYGVSVKLGVSASRSESSVVDWAGSVKFNRRHVELFGEERMEEFVQLEIAEAVAGIRQIFDQ